MLPKIKKRLSSFILDESGKISKSSLIKFSIISMVVSVSVITSSGTVSAMGCGCGGCGSCGACGGCGGGGGGGGGADPCAVGGSSPGGGCG